MSQFTLKLPVIADLIEGDEISTAEALGLSRESERAIIKLVRTHADTDEPISVSLQSITQSDKVNEMNELVFAIFEFGKITQRQICAVNGHNVENEKPASSILSALFGRGKKGFKDLGDLLRKAQEAGETTVIVGVGKDGKMSVHTEEEFKKKSDADNNKPEGTSDGSETK